MAKGSEAKRLGPCLFFLYCTAGKFSVNIFRISGVFFHIHFKRKKLALVFWCCRSNSSPPSGRVALGFGVVDELFRPHVSYGGKQVEGMHLHRAKSRTPGILCLTCPTKKRWQVKLRKFNFSCINPMLFVGLGMQQPQRIYNTTSFVSRSLDSYVFF